MKVKILMVVLLTTGLLASALAASPVAAEPTVFKWAFYQPPQNPVTISARWFAKEVERISEGQVQIKLFWSESLVGSKEMMEAVRDKVADMVFMCPSYHPSKTPLSSLTDVAFLVAAGQGGRQNIVFTRACVTPQFTKEYDKFNSKFLFFTYVPPYNLMGRVPVLNLGDIAGKRIRALGGLGDVLKSFGAVPVFTSAPETFEALQKGVIDLVAGCGDYWMDAYKIYEASKYYTIDMDMSASCLIALMNKESYAKLPEKVKKALPELQEKSNYVAQEALAGKGKIAAWRKKFEVERGIKITSFPPGDREKMKQGSVKFWEDWIAKMEKSGVEDARKTLYLVRDIIVEVEKQYPKKMLEVPPDIVKQVAEIEAEMKKPAKTK